MRPAFFCRPTGFLNLSLTFSLIFHYPGIEIAGKGTRLRRGVSFSTARGLVRVKYHGRDTASKSITTIRDHGRLTLAATSIDQTESLLIEEYLISSNHSAFEEIDIKLLSQTSGYFLIATIP